MLRLAVMLLAAPAAPGDRLKALRREGRADGYLRLLADWIKQDRRPPYGAAVEQDAP